MGASRREGTRWRSGGAGQGAAFHMLLGVPDAFPSGVQRQAQRLRNLRLFVTQREQVERLPLQVGQIAVPLS